MFLRIFAGAFCVSLSFFSFTIGAALQSSASRNSLLNTPDYRGKQLIIKEYPAVEDFQSKLYEVYAEPYTYDLRPVAAVAGLQGEGENAAKGEIIFVQRHPPAGPVIIRGNLTDLPPGKHGFHIHQAGDLRQGCDNVGRHFNPYLLQHGGPRDAVRHVGDLGNIDVKDDGTAEFSFADGLLSLSGGPRSIVGRAVVITSSFDDFGRGSSANSLIDGDSGKPIACGVISYLK